MHAYYLTIRQRGRVDYDGIVNEDEVRVDYSLINNSIVYAQNYLYQENSTETQQNASFLQ